MENNSKRINLANHIRQVFKYSESGQNWRELWYGYDVIIHYLEEDINDDLFEEILLNKCRFCGEDKLI